MPLNFYLLIILLVFFFSFFSLAPFLPTKTKDLERISNISKLKPWENFLEVWCWTAKVSIFVAKNNPENEIVWIELSPFLYVYSKIKSILLKQKNLKIIYWNALNLDFWKFDVIYIFWLDDTIKNKILPKIEKENRKNTRLLSYCFNPENEKFDQIKHKESNKELAIFEYKKK